MKKCLFLLLLLISISHSALSTIWIINNSGNNFTPFAITISLGDTVDFIIASSHTVIEVSQTTWNANGNTALSGGFSLGSGGGRVLPPQLGAGIHYYVCGPHASSGMKGTITVLSCTLPATPGAITGASPVCSGSSNTYSISAVSDATSYTWTLPGGWSGSSTTTSITAIASATGGNISVIAVNACGSSTAQTRNIAISSIPATPGSITGNSPVCSGSSNNYSITSVAGATSYTWTLPGGWSGSSISTSITATAGLTSGNVTVTANNVCGSSSAQTRAITVNSIPATPGSISGNGTICTGTSNTYSITTVPGATTYTWTLPSGWTGSSTTTSITATASSTSGNITVTASNTCGTSSARTFGVSVSTGIPTTPGSISGPTSICAGSTNTYSVIPVSGALTYTWTLPGGWIGTSSTNLITTGGSPTGGIISVTANNACGNSPARTLTVLSTGSIPIQPGAISGPTIVCSGSSNTYSVAAVSGATSYTWTLPGGWTGSSATRTIITTAGPSGNITVTANNACGSSAAQTIAITTNTIPALPGTITGNASVCSGSTNLYIVSSVPGATSYTWTLPGGWSGISTTTSISATASSTGGNITVSANNSCGSSAAQTISIIVNSVPTTPGSISGNTIICVDSSSTYTITAVPEATSYTWSLPGGWSGVSTTTSITATASSTSGNITVTADNACGSSTAQMLSTIVNTIPLTPVSISGNTTVCTNSSNTYSIASVPGATSYTWTMPGGWSGISTTTTIIATASSTSGNITVTANNSCGSSSSQTLSIVVNAAIPATPGSISGPTSICAVSSNTYSVVSVSGATSYTWTLPVGWSGTSLTNSITVTGGALGGSITVTANNSCGSSSARTLNVSVGGSSVPPQPGTINGQANVCSGSLNTYSVAPVSGVSYTWTLPGDWTGISASRFINTTAGTLSGTITVTANNACGSSAPQTLSITTSSGTPATPGIITGNTSVCSGSTNLYIVSSVPGATSYTWTLPGGWSGISTTTSITATAGLTGGNITVTANNACGSSTAQMLAVAINPLPSINCPVTLNIRVFFQALYLGNGTMRSRLFDSGLTGDTSIADSLIVELHSAVNPFSILASDTIVVGIDGHSTVSFPPIFNGLLAYVVVRHQNSIETWSKFPVTLTTILNYDFTTVP